MASQQATTGLSSQKVKIIMFLVLFLTTYGHMASQPPIILFLAS
jgi:hypothetical protein